LKRGKLKAVRRIAGAFFDWKKRRRLLSKRLHSLEDRQERPATGTVEKLKAEKEVEVLSG
jgi:hypothetical protein